MIIKEMESYVVCPKCGYGFAYTTPHTREKFETIYKNLFKIHMGKCTHCEEGVLTIREAKFKVSRDKERANTLEWQCSKCKAKWVEFNSYTIGKETSVGQFLKGIVSETVCPMCFEKNSSRVIKLNRK